MRKFRFLEHPTDLRMRVWGVTRKELFVQAAQGMMGKCVPLRKPGDPARLLSKPIKLSAPSVDDLFVAWLNEVLYQFSVHSFYFSDASFAALTDSRLDAAMQGWPVAQVNLCKGSGLEVKAATYHGLEIRSAPRWEAEVILDV